MRKPLGRKGIILLVVMALVGFFAFSLMTDYDQEFEEKELPEITYDVVAEKADGMFENVLNSDHFGSNLTEEPLILGRELNTYVAKDGTFLPTETWKYYPVFQADYVKGMVTARSHSGGEILLEYSTFLVEEVSDCYLNDEPYCFVIDRKSVWLVTEDEVKEVFVDSYENKELDFFDESKKADPRLELKCVSKGE